MDISASAMILEIKKKTLRFKYLNPAVTDTAADRHTLWLTDTQSHFSALYLGTINFSELQESSLEPPAKTGRTQAVSGAAPIGGHLDKLTL